MTDNNSPDGLRGRPFARGKSGNLTGRPRGARNHTTIAAEMLLEGEAENLTRKSVELALNGDIHALLLRLDRIIPPRREQALQGKFRAQREQEEWRAEQERRKRFPF